RLGDFFVLISDCANDRETFDGHSGFPGASISPLLYLHQHEKRYPRTERLNGQASRPGGVSTNSDSLGARNAAARIRCQAGRYRMVHLDAALTHGDGTADALQSDPYSAGS